MYEVAAFGNAGIEAQNFEWILKENIMNRFVTIKSFILVFVLLLGITPVNASERPFASSGNGAYTFTIVRNVNY